MFGDIKPLIMATLTFPLSQLGGIEKFSSEFRGKIEKAYDSTPAGKTAVRVTLTVNNEDHVVMAGNFAKSGCVVKNIATGEATLDLDALHGMDVKRWKTGNYDATGVWAVTNIEFGTPIVVVPIVVVPIVEEEEDAIAAPSEKKETA
jgi:hypothetical protein